MAYYRVSSLEGPMLLKTPDADPNFGFRVLFEDLHILQTLWNGLSRVCEPSHLGSNKRFTKRDPFGVALIDLWFLNIH